MDKSARLKILRILCGYTQDSLAAEIGVPRSALSIWESGKKYGPAEESVPKLAKAMRVSPGYLLFGEPMISECVWRPVVPKRKNHIQSMVHDLIELLPGFLEENGMGGFVSLGELSDGGWAILFMPVVAPSFLLSELPLTIAFKHVFDSIGTSIRKINLKKWNCDTFDRSALIKLATSGERFDYSKLQENLDWLLSKGPGSATAGPIDLLPESKEWQYQILKEWLREFWLTASEEKKGEFMKVIESKTDYKSWLEEYKTKHIVYDFL